MFVLIKLDNYELSCVAANENCLWNILNFEESHLKFEVAVKANKWCHDSQHYDTHHNDTKNYDQHSNTQHMNPEHNDTQHNNTQLHNIYPDNIHAKQFTAWQQSA